MAKAETIERGHTVRVMPTQEQQKWYRILTYVGVVVLVLGFLRYLQYNNQSELEAAARRGDILTVRQCLAGGLIGVDRQSALTAAINEGRGNIVRYLLAERAVKPSEGLDAAARSGRGDILRLLLETGATVRGEDGGKLLWRAAQSGDTETVYLLLHYGADKNLSNKADDGLTPLMYAAYSGKPGVVKALVDARANVKARSRFGRTALMIAAGTNDPLACKFLLDAGSEINAKDDNGRTALMSAAAVGKFAILDYLLNRGASTQVKDKVGKTALSYAIQFGDTRSANRLRRGASSSVALKM